MTNYTVKVKSDLSATLVINGKVNFPCKDQAEVFNIINKETNFNGIISGNTQTIQIFLEPDPKN